MSAPEDAVAVGTAGGATALSPHQSTDGNGCDVTPKVASQALTTSGENLNLFLMAW